MSFKQAIVVRTDLKMSKGKISAQVAHASLSLGMSVMRLKPQWFNIWTSTGQKKVVLKCDSLEELQKLKEKAKENNLPAEFVADKGLTEIPEGTITVLGIGPAPETAIDKVTGQLKLL